MTDLHRIAAARGGEVRGDTAFIPTPGHSKRDRGTSVTRAANAPGGFVVHSFNGGDALAIKDGLRADRLLPERERTERARDVGAWEYQDADGVTVYRKVRMALPDGGKSYRFEHPDGRGGWAPKRGDAAPVPYRLPDLARADRAAVLYMAEGEKHADKLANWGLLATSLRDWRRDFAFHVEGRRVVILPDNDTAGAEQADKARKLVEAAGGRSVVVDLPGLPPKGDIMDWSGDARALAALVDQALGGGDAKPQGLVPSKGINARDLLNMTFDPIRYVVPGYIAEGLTVLAGAPKIGKSWMALGLGAAVAAGEAAFGSVPCDAGDVLYLALEDNPRRLQKRLRQMNMGTVPDRLTFMTEWPDLDNGCLHEIERWIEDAPDPRMVIVDVFAKVKGAGRGDRPQYEMDYAAASGLQKLAGDHGVAIVLVHHTRKMEAEDPFDAVSGTRGLTGAADTVMVLQRAGGAAHPTLYVRGRDVEEAEVAMQFDREFGTWSIIGQAAEVAKTSERQEILDALRENGEPMGATELAGELGKKRDNVQHLLSRLAKEGKVEKGARGKYTPVTPFTSFTPDPETAEKRDAIVNGSSSTVHSFTHPRPMNDGDSERCERSERPVPFTPDTDNWTDLTFADDGEEEE